MDIDSKKVGFIFSTQSRKEGVMKKNKYLPVVLLVTFCIVACQSAIADEKTVKLTVPGCKWAATAAMVGSILNDINGVSKVDTDPEKHTATVTFDTKKTSVEAVKKALADGEFPVEGEPEFIT